MFVSIGISNVQICQENLFFVIIICKFFERFIEKEFPINISYKYFSESAFEKKNFEILNKCT